jgi:sensor histidine kinase regulating citrate/malate metabolism
MKAHDLKHFIADIGAGGKFDGLDEIKTAVEKYELTANTGNKALDVVLTEKTYLCNKNEINFSFMVKGEELSFMHTSDIASLFGNAIDNAIEYEKTVENKNKRYILLRVYRKVSLLSIHVENYCNQSYEMCDGLPVTTKSDKDNHGFGLKSIRYVAQKYGGNVTVKSDGGLFTLDIILPVSEQKV